MLALPSPPVDSTFMPGIIRNASADERGELMAKSSGDTLLTDTLESITRVPRATPVTVMRSRPMASFLVSAVSASAAHKLELTITASVLNTNFLDVLIIIFMSPHRVY